MPINHAENLKKLPELQQLEEEFRVIASKFQPLMQATMKKYSDDSDKYESLRNQARNEEERKAVEDANPDLRDSHHILCRIMHACKSIVDYYRSTVHTSAHIKERMPAEERDVVNRAAKTLVECARVSRSELREVQRLYDVDAKSALLACDELQAMAEKYLKKGKFGSPSFP